jgi:hypothetical protein
LRDKLQADFFDPDSLGAAGVTGLFDVVSVTTVISLSLTSFSV